METSDCVVAIEHGFFHDHGADERERFLAGAPGPEAEGASRARQRRRPLNK
jgi:hypothetical protein